MSNRRSRRIRPTRRPGTHLDPDTTGLATPVRGAARQSQDTTRTDRGTRRPGGPVSTRPGRPGGTPADQRATTSTRRLGGARRPGRPVMTRTNRPGRTSAARRVAMPARRPGGVRRPGRHGTTWEDRPGRTPMGLPRMWTRRPGGMPAGPPNLTRAGAGTPGGMRPRRRRIPQGRGRSRRGGSGGRRVGGRLGPMCWWRWGRLASVAGLAGGAGIIGARAGRSGGPRCAFRRGSRDGACRVRC